MEIAIQKFNILASIAGTSIMVGLWHNSLITGVTVLSMLLTAVAFIDYACFSMREVNKK